MSSSELARATDVAELLRKSGYEIAVRKLADREAVLGETAYALVACVEFDTWESLDEHVFDVQGALTRMAQEAPSARSWDLYVVALMRTPTSDAADRALAEMIEADTRYARKFVRVAIPSSELDRALRPLLPLRPPADLDIGDPLRELRDELLSLDVEDDVADRALEAFREHESVEVP